MPADQSPTDPRAACPVEAPDLLIARLRAQFQGFPLPTVIWQRQGDDFIMVDCNAAARAVTHGRLDAFLGHAASAAYADRPDILADLEHCARQQATLSREMAYRFISTGEEHQVVATYVFLPPDLVMFHMVITTEQARATAALQQSEARYRAIVQDQTDLICRWRPDGQLTFVNDAYCRAIGQPREAVLGRHLWTLLTPSQVGHAGARGSAGPDETIERQILLPDGAVRWLQWTDRAITDASGQVVEYQSVGRDITALKRAELAQRFLAEASQELAASLDVPLTLERVAHLALPLLADYCMIDLAEPDGSLSRVASAHRDPAKAALVDALRRYPPRNDRPLPITRALATGVTTRLTRLTDADLPTIAQDDEHLAIIRALAPVSGLHVPLVAHGRTLGVMTLVRALPSNRQYDADDERLAEEVARRAALAIDNARLYAAARAARDAAEQAADRTTRLQAITASLNEALTPEQVAEVIITHAVGGLAACAAALVAVDADGQTISHLGITGYGAGLTRQWLAKPLETTTPMHAALRTGAMVEITSLADRAARFPAHAAQLAGLGIEAGVAVPLLSGGRTLGVLGLSFAEPRAFTEPERAFLWAITRQAAQALERASLYATEQQARAATQAALEQLRESQAQLVQAGKLAAVGTLAAGIAHELNQPLMVIRGQAQIALADPTLAAAPRRRLARIEAQTAKMAAIIDHLRAFGRTGDPETAQVVDLNRVVEEVLLLIAAQLTERGIGLALALASPAPLALSDSNHVEQVVLNLLINARDALGDVPPGTRPGAIAVRTWRDEHGCHLTVTDSGPGIAPEALPRLFEPFFTTKPEGLGTGLGLPISRDLARRWGGDLTLAPRADGPGAVATLTLPPA